MASSYPACVPRNARPDARCPPGPETIPKGHTGHLRATKEIAPVPAIWDTSTALGFGTSSPARFMHDPIGIPEYRTPLGSAGVSEEVDRASTYRMCVVREETVALTRA